MVKLDIYTDGACSGNPGVGGWAFVIVSQGKKKLFSSGGELRTTNNRMELTAVVKSLQCLGYIFFKRNLDITIYSDSAYCVNAINQGWINFWKQNEWKTKAGEDVKNSDLWKKLDKLLHDNYLNVVFCKVKGHSGVRYNELADEEARNAICRLNSKSIQKGEVRWEA